MPRHGKLYLGHTKGNEPIRFSMKHCAEAPLCNILVVSFTFHHLSSFRAHILPHTHLRAGAEYGDCASRAPQQHRKIQRIRALAREHALTTVTSSKSSGPWACSQTRHLTKGPWYLLSSRDTHEEAYKRAWVFTTMCLLWVCLSNQYREQEVLPKVEKSRSDP